MVCQRTSPSGLWLRPAPLCVSYSPMPTYLRLEQKFGHLGIPGLIRILAFLKLITWVLINLQPDYYRALVFDLDAIASGQVWRLLSFLLVPASSSIIYILFEVIFLFMVGDGLERAWGPFGVTLYFFASALCGVLVATLVKLTVGEAILANFAIYGSIIMAASFLYADTIIHLYLVIPVKFKYIGMLTAGFILLQAYSFSAYRNGFVSGSIPMLACLIPFVAVFGPIFVRGAKHRSEVAARRSRFESAKVPANEAFHKCDRCGATEVSEPDREFRITADGREELCNVCRSTSD